MKHTVTSIDYLRNVFVDASNALNERKCINVSIEPVKQWKTKKQLGFMFGGLADAVKRFLMECGEDISVEDIKEGFYQECSEDIIKHKLDGKPYIHKLRISEMSKKQMSEFTERVIDYIDNVLDGCVLTPDLRYTWTRYIDAKEAFKIEYESAAWSRLSPEFLSYQRKQSCLNCGVFGCVAHHVRAVNDAGVALKAPDYLTMPLCDKCHKELHNTGEKTFYKKLGQAISDLPVEIFCMHNYKKWLLKQ